MQVYLSSNKILEETKFQMGEGEGGLDLERESKLKSERSSYPDTVKDSALAAQDQEF